MANVFVQIEDQLFEKARVLANMDHISVEELVIGSLRHRIEYIERMFEIFDLPEFSLDNYEMHRVPGETDAEYEDRLNLFR